MSETPETMNRDTFPSLCGALLLVLSAAAFAKAPQTCPPPGEARADTIKAITAFFAAAKTNDPTGFNAHITKDFYAYDGGKRFDGASLWGFIQTLQAAGKKFEWTVTEPEVHLVCAWAWVTYVNKGSVTDASGRQDVTWLESAILQHQRGQWRMQFLHSTRSPPH